MIPGIESLACGPLAVPEEVMAHVVHVESSRNPFAIGVVGGRLLRQPRNLGEAVATVRMLEDRGYNYSIGLAQVNRVNFARFGFDTPEAGFDVCNNLAAGAKILAECLQRHDGRWGDAFSCYYSGNARTGYEHGYVQKVFAAMSSSPDSPAAPGVEAIGLAPAGTPAPSRPSAAPTPWDAVYAARISAPDARRVDAVSRVEPLTRPSVSDVVAADVPDIVAESMGAEVSEASPVAGGSPVPDTPEARFIAEMRGRASQETGGENAQHAGALGRVSSEGETSVEADSELGGGSPASAVTQQESNSRAQDTARVF